MTRPHIVIYLASTYLWNLDCVIRHHDFIFQHETLKYLRNLEPVARANPFLDTFTESIPSSDSDEAVLIRDGGFHSRKSLKKKHLASKRNTGKCLEIESYDSQEFTYQYISHDPRQSGIAV